MNPDLKAKVVELLFPYRPSHIGIFGSYARGENMPDSDLDILISFSELISLFKLVQIELELSDKLGIPIDLVIVNSIKNPRLKSHILRDLITIYG